MSATENHLIPAEIRDLFDNTDPFVVWAKTSQIVISISPNIELSRVRKVFDDVLGLFEGSYPHYTAIKTPYHDLPHTLDVLMCATRLVHGVHLADTRLSDEEICLVLVAALLHDVGYAQKSEVAVGSGAQYTLTHIARGIEFMQQNLVKWDLPPEWGRDLAAMIRCTDLGHNLSSITFANSRVRLLGQLVASADLVGQMSDRVYLEKLLFLYLEFKEADFGNYQSIHDLLKKTRSFYQLIRTTLEGELGGVYHRLSDYFKYWCGDDRNYYLESIERNIEYLDRVISLNEDEWLSMLKRHGVVKAIQEISKGHAVL